MRLLRHENTTRWVEVEFFIESMIDSRNGQTQEVKKTKQRSQTLQGLLAVRAVLAEFKSSHRPLQKSDSSVGSALCIELMVRYVVCTERVHTDMACARVERIVFVYCLHDMGI